MLRIFFIHLFVPLSVWTISAGFAPPAGAHIEKGFMPDSVAEMEYRILLEFNPEDIKTRNLLGMALLRMNKLKEAEAEFRQALKTKPDDFDATDALGLVLLKQNRAPEALPLLEKAVTMNQDDCLARMHLGQAREAAGKLDAAEQAYLAARTNCGKDSTEGAAERRAEAERALAGLRARRDAPAAPAAQGKP